MAPQDGAIRAMIGGFDYNRGTFNRATQAWRQPGSNIKPFVYAAALERGLTPATQISDQPFMLTAEQTGSKAWSPKNDGNRYEPMLTLRQGLMRSKNMVSIRILQAIGPQYAQDYLTRFGFDKARWPAVLPLALGAGGATPLQVVNGYSVFANGGYRVTPFLIDRVTDRSGHVLMQAQPVVAGDAAARHRPAHRLGHGRHPARRRHQRHRARAPAAQAQRRGRQDGHHQRGRGRLVLGLHAHAGHHRLDGLRPAALAGHERIRQRPGPEHLAGLHAARAQGRAESKPAPRPDGLLVDNGEFYFSEFPPGQAVASLDLSSGDPLTDFLNNNRSTGGVDNTVRPLPTPGAALPGAGQPRGTGRRRTARDRPAGPGAAARPAGPGAGGPAAARADARRGAGPGAGPVPGQAPRGDPAFPPIPVPRV